MNVRIPKWLVGVGVFLGGLALLIGLRYVAVGLGWITKPADVLTADEAEAQVTNLTDQYNELTALLVNLDSYEAELQAIEVRNAGYTDQSQWSTADRSSWAQWNKQLIDALGEYNRRCGDYNAAWDNFFESGAAKLYGLDDQIPTRCELAGFGS